MDLYFDLDGTLTDPFEGITKSIIFALEKLGISAPEPRELSWAIGPALVDSFDRMGVVDPNRALALYRERYTVTGIYENEVYPGMLEGLAALRASGHRMFLMTAKPHSYAKLITRHYGISQFMEAEYGPELDGTRNDKAELLSFALEETKSDPNNSLMIGDRVHDIRAGALNDMRTVAVQWGYGSPDEHAKADYTANNWPGMVTLINEIQGS